MDGFAALIVIGMVFAGMTAILSFVLDRHKRKESLAGVVVDRSVKYHHTADGAVETLWVLTLEDKTGRRFGRLVTEAFFDQTALGDRVCKDAGSEIRRPT